MAVGQEPIPSMERNVAWAGTMSQLSNAFHPLGKDSRFHRFWPWWTDCRAGPRQGPAPGTRRKPGPYRADPERFLCRLKWFRARDRLPFAQVSSCLSHFLEFGHDYSTLREPIFQELG